MQLNTTVELPPPDGNSNEIPYIGWHLHEDSRSVIVWLILNGGRGLVIAKTGSEIPDTNPVEYYSPVANLFELGYEEYNAVTKYGIRYYEGTITMANA